MGQCKYLIRVLSGFPNSDRVYKRIIPLAPSGRRLGVKSISTKYVCISMTYGERIHVLLGRAYAYETASVCALFSDLWRLVERCQLQIL
jgi:hypothetical protein